MSNFNQENYEPTSPFKALHIERLLQIRAFYLNIKDFIDSLDKEIQEKYDEDTLRIARNQGIEEVFASDFKPFFMSLLFIQIRTTLDIYFNDILELIFINHIDILKNSSKQHSTEEILSFDDMDDLIRYLGMKEIQRFNDNNSKNKIEYLKKLLNKEQILTEMIISKFIEVSEIRNILVHNEGRINDRFEKLVNNPKYNNKISIEINEGILLEAIESMISLINEIDKEFCNKFKIDIF